MQVSIEFNLKFNSLQSLNETSMLVSSAKSMVLEDSLMMDGKSFMYKLNGKGPSTDPGGIPRLTTSQLLKNNEVD
jgi:hypothetical protein